MSSIPAIALPIISRGDMLERCLLSLDYPVDNLVIFVNSDDPSIGAALSRINNPQIKRLTVQHRLAYGRGCGPAINEVVKAFPHGPYWMLVGADNYFPPGVLKTIDQYCRANTDSLYFWAHDVIPILTMRGVQEIGLFDENLYPCYFEDADYTYRLKLAGEAIRGIEGIQVGHGSDAIRGNVTTNTDLDLRFKNEISYSLNSDYYKEKWGGAPTQETFQTPFNLPSCPVSFWSFDPLLRVERLWEDIGTTFIDERLKFIRAFVSFVSDETDARLTEFKDSRSPDDFVKWRLGSISLSRHIAAIPSDCIEACWKKCIADILLQHVDPALLANALSSEMERATLADLKELFGTKFDLQARLAILFLTGDVSFLHQIEAPSWLS